MEEGDEYWMESDSGSDGGDLDFDEGDGEEVRERAGCPPRLLTPPPLPPVPAHLAPRCGSAREAPQLSRGPGALWA